MRLETGGENASGRQKVYTSKQNKKTEIDMH